MRIYFIIVCFLFTCLAEDIMADQVHDIDSLELLLSRSKPDTFKIKILGHLAIKYQSVNNRKSEKYALEQVALSQKLEYKKGLADGYNNLGVINKFTANYLKALEYFKISNKYFEELKDEKSYVINLSNIGTVYYNLGDFVSATRYIVEALKIKERLGNQRSLAKSYINAGALFFSLGELDQANSYFLNALEINRKFDDHKEISKCLINIGEVYQQKGNFSKANEYFFNGLEEAQKDGNLEQKSRAQLSIGSSYLEQKLYINAIRAFKNSLAIAEVLQDEETATQNLMKLGICYHEAGNLDTSLFYLIHAFNKADQIGTRDLFKQCSAELSQVYKKKKDFEKAMYYYKRYTTIKDSLYNIENTRQIAVIQTKYAMEKKDNQILLLAKDKEIQKATIGKQNTSRNYLLGGFSLFSMFCVMMFLYYNQKKKDIFKKQVSKVEMKALRAQMNPHFIFNSLNSIHKYIQLKDADLASEYLIKFSKLIRLILENSRFQEVSLEKDIKALELYIQLEALRMDNNFTYEIFIDPSIDSQITLVPPLILQPFVENAIWHGLQHKQGGGKIKIEIKREKEMITCIVEDNGIGRLKEMEMKAKIVNNKGESLGMKITDARIDILNKIKKSNAMVQVVDLSEGVRVEVKLPLELSF